MARPVRRTQAVAPFGVGAMVDFPGPISLIHAGLDAWPYREEDPASSEFEIRDDHRLAARLGVDFFVKPPDFRSAAVGTKPVNAGLYLPFLRFPRWHVCPRCGRMSEGQLHDRAAPVCVGPVGSGKDKGKLHRRRNAVQVRFVAACVKGHLQDFPWWEWVLRAAKPDSVYLRMISTGSASVAGVKIQCEGSPDTVVGSRTLAGAFGEPGVSSGLASAGVDCNGSNPALGIPSATTPSPGCGQPLYTLLRGASNLYFPKLVSSIYLPPKDQGAGTKVLEILEDVNVWQFLNAAAAAMDGEVPTAFAKQILLKRYPQADVTPEELADAANRRLHPTPSTLTTPVSGESEEAAFRRQEHELLSSDVHEGYPQTNLLVRVEKLERYHRVFSSYFDRVSLVHKLRETRAFVGFSRIFPEDGLSDDERRRLLTREPKHWLPAVTVRGEGIFLSLSERALRKWTAANEDVLGSRAAKLERYVNQRLLDQRREAVRITPRYVLLHTLSHLLINELVYECGYSSAALRERLYASADADHPMAGVLIYTAAGDSEGSMGGLVRMGQPGRLEGVFSRAIFGARWCSTDPLCLESSGQGPDNCNLAACHSCVLVPETSCEEQNRILDRGLVIGTLEYPGVGFFSDFGEHLGTA